MDIQPQPFVPPHPTPRNRPPTSLELIRTSMRNPERGRIGIFNRSYYEEVLVVRVHPEYLEGRPHPSWQVVDDDLWSQRFASIRDQATHCNWLQNR